MPEARGLLQQVLPRATPARQGMKIALVCPYDHEYPGGVTAHINHLARQFNLGGHTVKIIAPSSNPRHDQSDEGFIPLGRPVPVPSGGSIARISLSVWLGPRIKAILDREAFDVIHLHEPLAPFLPLGILQASKTTNIGTFHAYHGSTRLYWGGRFLVKHWFQKLDGRIAVSRPALQYVSRYFPGEYRIIPNGVDVDRFSTRVRPFSEFMDGKLNILFVGRLERRKGLKYLLEAFSRLKWDFANLRLLVVGPGRLDEDSQRVLSERNVQDVVFLGTVSEEDLCRYYHTADIFCSPATGKESFGIVLLEAMAAGRPIVATSIPGYSDVLTHGQEGLLVEPKSEEALAEALALLINDPSLRGEVGARGRARAEEFRWEKIASQVMDYYLYCMNSPPHPR